MSETGILDKHLRPSCDEVSPSVDFPSCDESMSEGEPEETMHDDTTNLVSATPRSQFSDDCQRNLHVKAEKPYVFIELCAGSASLSAAVRSLGVEVMAFDHESNRHKTKCKVVCFDLSLPRAYDRIVDWLAHVTFWEFNGTSVWHVQQSQRDTHGRRHSRIATSEISKASAGIARP